MTHSQLVVAATDLLADVPNPERWLVHYDAALGSASDALLATLVVSLDCEAGLHGLRRLAAMAGKTTEVANVELYLPV